MSDPTTDCPPCPACKCDLGTPIRDCNRELTTDRWDGPRDATLWCPSCGHGWVGTPADLARAHASLRAYYAQEGWLDADDVGPAPDEAARVATVKAHDDPRQLALPLGAQR